MVRGLQLTFGGGEDVAHHFAVGVQAVSCDDVADFLHAVLGHLAVAMEGVEPSALLYHQGGVVRQRQRSPEAVLEVQEFVVAFVDDVKVALRGGDDDDAGRRGKQLAVVIGGVAAEDAAIRHAFHRISPLIGLAGISDFGEGPHARQTVQFRLGRVVAAARQSCQEDGQA